MPQRPVLLKRFANDCLEVQLQANCRERDVFIIQPLVPAVQEHLAEPLPVADAARGASAARVTAVMSHYAYARSDKEDEPRISIGGRLVADLLVTAGVNRVLTLTLHSPHVTVTQSALSMPVLDAGIAPCAVHQADGGEVGQRPRVARVNAGALPEQVSGELLLAFGGHVSRRHRCYRHPSWP